MKRYWLVTIAGFALLALLLAACSPVGTEISVEVDEFSFTPAEWTVVAGEEVTLTIHNNGRLRHRWVLSEEGEGSDESVVWSVDVAAGEVVTTTFQAPSRPGLYHVMCGICGHPEEWKDGTLVVAAR